MPAINAFSWPSSGTTPPTPIDATSIAPYIRKCLDEQAGTTNVIQLTGAEFTGPLHFMQFWLDTVAQWERDTGKHVIVGLSATKDVQDAILSDPVRAPIVSVIDIRYWWYQLDGKPYAPLGGLSMRLRAARAGLSPQG